VVVTGRRGFYVNDFQQLRWRAARVQADLQIMGQVSKYVFEIALVIGAALLALSQFWSKDVVAAVAVIAVFLAATSRITPALMRIHSGIFSIRYARADASSTIDLAAELLDSNVVDDLDTGQMDRVGANRNSDHEGFDGVVSVGGACLEYPGTDTRALEQISLHVAAGSSLALVGPTGAGKSSLGDIILGVLTPDSGTVLISHVPPADATARWPGALAYVPQDIAVIDGTVRSNVAAGLPSELIDDDRVWEALDRAQLGDYLRGERDGLDTVVGEHGVRLSGGQRQRLGLARALYTRPKLLVLDEATSALDAETELAVSQALDSLEGDVTLIVVAHRLATIRHSDQVAYLQDGRLMALGTFEEVREQVPNFDRQAQLLGL
jgi:ABC-type multidrug transport system fused ATPase/permease subunit